MKLDVFTNFMCQSHETDEDHANIGQKQSVINNNDQIMVDETNFCY